LQGYYAVPRGLLSRNIVDVHSLLDDLVHDMPCLLKLVPKMIVAVASKHVKVLKVLWTTRSCSICTATSNKLKADEHRASTTVITTLVHAVIGSSQFNVVELRLPRHAHLPSSTDG
jgi:hypothetical protein